MIAALPQSTFNRQQQQLINHDTVAWAVPFRLCSMGLMTLSSLVTSSATTTNCFALSSSSSSSSSSHQNLLFSLSPLGIFCAMMPSQISPSLFISKLLAFGTITSNRQLALGLASLFINGSVFTPFVREGREIRHFLSGNFPLSDVDAELRALRLYYSSTSGNNNGNQLISQTSIQNCERIQNVLRNFLTKETNWWRSLASSSSTSSTSSLSSSLFSSATSSNETYEVEAQRHATIRFLVTSAAYPDIFSTKRATKEGGVVCCSDRGSGVTLSVSVPSDSLLVSPNKNVIYPSVKSVASCGGIVIRSASSSPPGTASSSPFCLVSPLPSSMISILLTACSLANNNSNTNNNNSSSSVQQQQFTSLENNTHILNATSTALQHAKNSKKIDAQTGKTTNVVSSAAPCRGWWPATTQDWRTTSLARASNVVQPSAPQVRLEPVQATIFDPLQLPSSSASSTSSSSLLSGVQANDLFKLSDLSINTIAKIRNGMSGAFVQWLQDEAAVVVSADENNNNNNNSSSSSCRHVTQMQEKIGEVVNWVMRRELGALSFLRERRRLFGGVTIAKTKLIPFSQFSFGSATAADIRDRKSTREYFDEVAQESKKLMASAAAALAVASSTTNSNIQSSGTTTSSLHQQHHQDSFSHQHQTQQLLLPFYGQKPQDQHTLQLIEKTAGIVARTGSRLKEAALSTDAFPFLNPAHEFHGYYLYLLKKLNPEQIKVFGDDIDELKVFMNQLEKSITGRGMPPQIPLPYDLNELNNQDQQQQNSQDAAAAAAASSSSSNMPNQQQQQHHQRTSKVTVVHEGYDNNNAEDTVVEELGDNNNNNNNNQHQTSLLSAPPTSNNDDNNQQQQHFAYSSVPTFENSVYAYAENAILQKQEEDRRTGKFVEIYPGYSSYDYYAKDAMNGTGFRWQIDPTYQPLSEPPPKIPTEVLEKDPRYSRPPSVIIWPVPKMPPTIKDAPAVVVCKALGEFLGTNVGPCVFIGNAGRVTVPTAALEARALALKQFICMGKRVTISKNDRMYDVKKTFYNANSYSGYGGYQSGGGGGGSGYDQQQQQQQYQQPYGGGMMKHSNYNNYQQKRQPRQPKNESNEPVVPLFDAPPPPPPSQT